MKEVDSEGQQAEPNEELVPEVGAHKRTVVLRSHLLKVLDDLWVLALAS